MSPTRRFQPEEEFRFAHGTLLQTILSIAGSRFVIRKMAVEVSTTSSAWLDSTGIWLFCIERDVYTVEMRDCPSIKVSVRVGHVTPANKALVRRYILFADDDQLNSTLTSKESPALLLVNNSCNFKVFYHHTAYFSVTSFTVTKFEA